MKYLLLILSLSVFGACAAPKKLEIYQGIVPSASGPGIEMTLFLYADHESVIKFTYVSRETSHDYDFGTWEKSANLIRIKPLDEDSFAPEFIIEGDDLVYSNEGKELYAGVDRARLVKISK